MEELMRDEDAMVTLEFIHLDHEVFQSAGHGQVGAQHLIGYSLGIHSRLKAN